MEKNRINKYKPSTGDGSHYYRETTAVNKLARVDSSAALGNLADVLKSGPVVFPNILAPDAFKQVPLGNLNAIESHDVDTR